jgi:hypothetical protein
VHGRALAHEETFFHREALLNQLLRLHEVLLELVEGLLHYHKSGARLADDGVERFRALGELGIRAMDNDLKVVIGLQDGARQVVDDLTHLLPDLVVELPHGLSHAVDSRCEIIMPLKVLMT